MIDTVYLGLRARCGELETALRPFALLADQVAREAITSPTYATSGLLTVRYADLRRASEALHNATSSKTRKEDQPVTVPDSNAIVSIAGRTTIDLGDLPTGLPAEIVVHLRMLALTAHNLARLGYDEIATKAFSRALADGALDASAK